MSGFAKAFPDAGAAAEAVRRGMALRTQGLDTPAARVRGASVVFGRIEGVTGLPLLRVAPASWLRPLAVLHRCTLPGLAPLDPLRRIRPRIGLLTAPALRAALERLAEPVPRGTALVHGDFHTGQLIRGTDGTVWMVDLDDLALGPPEADLANLIANLATRELPQDLPQELPDDFPDDFGARLAGWRARLTAAWAEVSGAVDAAVLDHHLALALIRRHLKLREAGRPDFEAEVAGWVSPVACRTSPSGSAAYPG